MTHPAPSRPRSRVAAAAASIAAAAVGSVALAQLPRPAPDAPASPHELLTSSLAVMTIDEIVSFDASGITFKGAPAASTASGPPSPATRRTVTVPLADIAAIVPAGWYSGASGPRPAPSAAVASADSSAVLRLADGSRLVGGIPRATPPADRLTWVHGRLGRITYKLDAVAGIDFDPVSKPAPAAASPAGPGAAAGTTTKDTLTLLNGDRLAGFFLGIALITSETNPSLLVARVEADAGVTNIAIDRVVRIDLANPLQAPVGPRLWLSDGSIVAPLEFLADPRGVAVRLARDDDGVAEVSLGTSLVQAALPRAERVVPLAALPVRTQAPAPGRRWTPGVRVQPEAELLGAADITIPGPMTAEWELPTLPAASNAPASSAAAATAHLGMFLTLPESAWPWGEFTVTVELVPSAADAPARTLATARLSAAQPVVPVNAAISLPPASTPSGPSRLRITVAAGERGPIQNTLVIRRALLVLPPAAPLPPPAREPR